MDDSDYRWLLESDDVWPRILADEPFWEAFDLLTAEERPRAIIERVFREQPFMPEDEAFDPAAVETLRRLRISQAAAIVEMIDRVGLARTRETLQRRRRPQ